MFLTLWQRYQKATQHVLDDFAGFAFHLPYTKMGKKALDQIMAEASPVQQTRLATNLTASQAYSRQVGNLYTGSVYLSLLSLLSHATDLVAGEDLAVFSYGSGAEAELYSVTLQDNFADYVPKTMTDALLAKRQLVSVAEYEKIFQSQLYNSHVDAQTQAHDDAKMVQFLGWQGGERLYR